MEAINTAASSAFKTDIPSNIFGAIDFGRPTIDRPFGLALWPLFRYLVYTILHKDIENFEYVYNSSTPLSSVPHVLTAIAAYYIIIFGGRWATSKLRPIKLTFIFRMHNLLLTILSGFLLLLLAEQEIPAILHNGVFYSICDDRAWTQKTEFLYYLNYLTKYYELFDTVFMVLRKRPLTFLHTYHHGATAMLCFSQLNGRTPVSYVPITLNLAVHVLMYFYYFLSSCGIRPWWKTWVTRFQIIQFIIDLGFVYFASYTHFVAMAGVNLPNMGSCSGEPSAAVDGCLILSSYLVLFVSFYIKSYIVPAAAKKALKNQQKAEKNTESVEQTPEQTEKTQGAKASASAWSPISKTRTKRSTRRV